jgi:hypothetical protein
MSNKTVSVVLSEDEVDKLDDLVEFFQKKSISTVTKSDVLKFLINKTHDVSQEENLKKVKEFYLAMGIELDFEVLNFK